MSTKLRLFKITILSLTKAQYNKEKIHGGRVVWPIYSKAKYCKFIPRSHLVFFDIHVRKYIWNLQ